MLAFFFFCLTGIGSILFETRLGCLGKEIPSGAQEFITSISQMFSNSIYVAIFPKWSHNLLPYWGRYIASWDGIFRFGEPLKPYTEMPLTHFSGLGKQQNQRLLVHEITNKTLKPLWKQNRLPYSGLKTMLTRSVEPLSLRISRNRTFHGRSWSFSRRPLLFLTCLNPPLSWLGSSTTKDWSGLQRGSLGLLISLQTPHILDTRCLGYYLEVKLDAILLP